MRGKKTKWKAVGKDHKEKPFEINYTIEWESKENKKMTKAEIMKEIQAVNKEYRILDEKRVKISEERDKLIIALSRANKIIDHIIYLGTPKYHGDSTPLLDRVPLERSKTQNVLPKHFPRTNRPFAGFGLNIQGKLLSYPRINVRLLTVFQSRSTEPSSIHGFSKVIPF